ncbi:MAG TPA: glycosyl hydrolase 108 family protein [Candidatus Angelobacter sp.]|jgi:lysozyme family protein|nr:glycosyl hydrolase 108 family protein [Candidatus Angelobacter sp.]
MSVTQFAPAFEFLMKHEDPGLTGKVTNDSGGVTRWGISQNAYPDLDIANLPLEEAANIYRRDYFQPIRGYDYLSQNVANKLLDAAVNMGVHMAVKLAQECANLCGQEVHTDGVAGTFTVNAINAINPILFLDKYRELLSAHYRDIAAARPDEAQYLNGWLRRASA